MKVGLDDEPLLTYKSKLEAQMYGFGKSPHFHISFVIGRLNQ